MVTRLVKRAKFVRWRVDFAKNKRVKTWKQILKAVVRSGQANVTFRDVALHRVELSWPKAVSYDSAAWLVRFAKEKDASLEIMGEPTGIADAEMPRTKMPRTKLRQLRPLGLRMTRVGP